MDAHTSPGSAPSRGGGPEEPRPGEGGGPDFGAVFAAMPGINLLLAPDPPRFTMLAASDERLAATLTTHEKTLGRPLFEVFSDGNPENGEPSGVANLRASLETVLRTRAPDRMAVQRYDLRRPDGTWEVRHWAPRNVPVLGPDGGVRYLLHHVEDVTEAVRRGEAHDRLRDEYVESQDARQELGAANARLLEQQLELELANQQLQDQSAELELQAEELQFAAAALEERTAEAERARAAADAATRRLAFLADASERLAASLDYETTLREVLALAVPLVADWALYTVDAGDGTLRLVASRHAEPAKEAFIAASARRYPIRADEPAGAARVLRTGEPELIPQIPDAVLEAVARDPEHLEILRAVGFRSLMTVPVITQGRVLGALGFVTGESGRLYGPEDLTFAQELARRAATALDQARLYAEAETARREAEAERERAAGILETMADAHFVLDADFRIVTVNAAMERSTGLSRDALLGRVFWEMFPASVGTQYERHYRAAASEGATAHFTDTYDDGRLALVSEADVYPVAGGGVAVFWRDVTARVQAEAALRESEALARQLFELSPVPKWVYDVESLAILDVNDAAVRHYGYTREEFLAMTIRDIRPSEEVPRMLAVAQAPHPVGASQGVFHHRTRSGEIIDVEVFLRDIPYQGQRAVIAVVQDVTERRRAEAALLQASEAAEAARAAAEAANRAKSEFLAVMSHELRTPLNAIGGYAELIELGIHGPVTDAQRTALARIQRSQRHLLGLIAGVLDYSRVEAGAATYRIVDVPVTEAVAEAELLVAPQLRAKRLGYAWSGAAPGLRVRADREKLQQILLNLLSNAVKFTDARDGVPGRVAVTCTMEKGDTDAAAGGRVRIEVRDTGAGIAPDALERVFEPFVQADQRLTRLHAGVGLGLAISRDLARGMGGDLTVESTPDVGSTFTLTLPAA